MTLLINDFSITLHSPICFCQTPPLLSRPKPSDIFTAQLPFDRHVDVFHQLKHQIPTLLKEKSREVKRDQVETLEQRLLNGADVSQDPMITAPVNDAATGEGAF